MGSLSGQTIRNQRVAAVQKVWSAIFLAIGSVAGLKLGWMRDWRRSVAYGYIGAMVVK